MVRKLLLGVALSVGVVGAVATDASAFDCIRVSSSLQGLQNSTRSGNWLLFDLSSPTAVQNTASVLFGLLMPTEQATCVADEYAAFGVTPYFALGVGVAGGHTSHGTGVLAHRAPERVLSDLRGIDHLDDSPIGRALFSSLEACGVAGD